MSLKRQREERSLYKSALVQCVPAAAGSRLCVDVCVCVEMEIEMQNTSCSSALFFLLLTFKAEMKQQEEQTGH